MQGRMVGVIGSESDVCVWMITSKTRNALQRVTRNHGGNEQQWLVVCAISRAGDLAILWLLLISHGRGLLLLRESSIRQTSPKAKTLWLVEGWWALPEHDEGTVLAPERRRQEEGPSSHRPWKASTCVPESVLKKARVRNPDNKPYFCGTTSFSMVVLLTPC